MTNEITESFKGYSLFNDIEDITLRAYNQYTVIQNMLASRLTALAEDYLAKINKADRLGIVIVSEYIRQKGLEEVKRELIKEGKLA